MTHDVAILILDATYLAVNLHGNCDLQVYNFNQFCEMKDFQTAVDVAAAVGLVCGILPRNQEIGLGGHVYSIKLLHRG